MKPLKLETYNAIVQDFNKCHGLGRKYENELKAKYKQ